MLTAPLKPARDCVAATAAIIRPHRRRRPSEAASEFLHNDKGRWDPSLTPMMIEPLDALGGRDYQGVVFVGPARSGKTYGLILAGVAYVVTTAPGDMLITQMSQDSARDFSRADLDRAIRHSPELASRMSPRARDDNTFDKFWRSGIVLKLGWPAVSQLSSKTLQYVFLTDYDRPENRDDVDGEGPLWDLAIKRVETFMSRGKCVAESSPGESYTDPKWRQVGHEAPPSRGILSLYNRGTRARWYWQCQHCREHFEAAPGLSCFPVPAFDEVEKRVVSEDLVTLSHRWARVVCPHCGGLHDQAHRRAMNAAAMWVHEGQRVERGSLVGDRRSSQIASYWLGGCAAAYQTWHSIVLRYLQAVATYVQIGDEAPLKATTNTDQGAPYLPIAITKRRNANDLMARLEDWPERTLPAGVRFLTAAVDVQAHRFVVTVMGWGIGLESWLVDRFSISSSGRPEGPRHAALDPAAYGEDWDCLVPQVIERVYCRDGDGRMRLSPMLVLCDSGGRDGVTTQAYEFWRRLRARNLGKRLMLAKGVGQLNSPRCALTWPDSKGRKDRAGGGRGDVPVWLLNVNMLKDGVAGDLSREEPGPSYCHIPSWVDEDFFAELTAEQRTARGWIRAPGARNEAFDLHVYNRAACVVLEAEAINWAAPPVWAAPLETRGQVNPMEGARVSRSRRMRSKGL